MFSKAVFRAFVMASVIACPVPAVLAMGSSPKIDHEAANLRIQPVARVEMAAAAVNNAAPRSGEQLYKAVCLACHDAGAAGAPKLGDKAAWAPRIGVGLDVLTKTAIAGKNAMPPKGGAADASDEEIARAIVFMANKSGASFKEPAAGAKPAASDKNPEQIAQGACFKCHETGDQGAPKLSDKAAWTQRVAKGLDAVTKTVIRGHGKMPARGGVADLTDAELKATIALLFRKVGSEIK
jgi:cytochrome c5